jgi:hypothetical protein
VNGNTRFRPTCSALTGRDLHPLDFVERFHRLIFGSPSSRFCLARSLRFPRFVSKCFTCS